MSFFLIFSKVFLWHINVFFFYLEEGKRLIISLEMEERLLKREFNLFD
jgi:hypothetical protein